MPDNSTPSAAFSQLATAFKRKAANFENARAATGTLAMKVLAKDDPELHQSLLNTFETAAKAGRWLTGVVSAYKERPLILLHQGKRDLVMHSLDVIQGNSCA